MSMVAEVVSMLDKVLGRDVEVLAQKHAVIQRKRKFRGQSLLRMIVLTLWKKPDATFADMAFTAAQLGVHVSATAVEKRFTQPLVDFLKDALSVALQQLVAAESVPVELLDRFTAFFIGDSSSIRLPDELQHEYPGCGGTEGSGLAALKIQVRWNLKTGELPQVLIEIGRASDAKSPIAQQEPLAGSLEIFDLGYFSLERFRRLDAAKSLLYLATATRHDRSGRAGRGALAAGLSARKRSPRGGRCAGTTGTQRAFAVPSDCGACPRRGRQSSSSKGS